MEPFSKIDGIMALEFEMKLACPKSWILIRAYQRTKLFHHFKKEADRFCVRHLVYLITRNRLPYRFLIGEQFFKPGVKLHKHFLRLFDVTVP